MQDDVVSVRHMMQSTNNLVTNSGFVPELVTVL